MVIKCDDPWSPKERKIKKLFEKEKGKLFHPIIKELVKLHIQANTISYISTAIGLISVLFLWIDLRISAVLLACHLLIDGIDGSLARYIRKNKLPYARKCGKLQGSITDSFSDQIVISSTTLGYIAIGILNPIIGGLYLIAYPMQIVFSTIRNIIEIPNPYVLRPRIYIYILFGIFAFTSINYLNHATLLFSVILLIYIIHDFFSIRKWISKYGETTTPKKRKK
jgi:hypothetical protein